MSIDERARLIHKRGLKRVKTTNPPAKQLFPIGSFVQIAKDLGSSMSHFENDRPAQVQYTYKHAYGGDERQAKIYSLLVRYDNGTWNSIAWYEEHQLTRISNDALISQYILEIVKGRAK